MNKPVQIIQPNQITNARYEFTALQKNIIYEIIGVLQKHMSNEERIDMDLFNNFIISLDVNSLVKGTNYKPVWDAAEKLQNVSFKFDYNAKDGKHRRSAVLVTTVNHKYGSGSVEIRINQDAIPVLLYIGKGFTQYQKTIAITLRSVHAKRMYELCNRWKDQGGFIMTLKEFRQTLNIEKKYGKIYDLKNRVLDTAQKELKQSADVWFEYEMKKVSSRSFNVIQFKILNQKNIPGQEDKSGIYSSVVRFLSFTYPLTKDNSATRIADKLLNTRQIDQAERRFRKLFDEYGAAEKSAEDVVRLTKHILKNDFSINP